jgi:hypothetical protein
MTVVGVSKRGSSQTSETRSEDTKRLDDRLRATATLHAGLNDPGRLRLVGNPSEVRLTQYVQIAPNIYTMRMDRADLRTSGLAPMRSQCARQTKKQRVVLEVIFKSTEVAFGV